MDIALSILSLIMALPILVMAITRDRRATVGEAISFALSALVLTAMGVLLWLVGLYLMSVSVLVSAVLWKVVLVRALTTEPTK